MKPLVLSIAIPLLLTCGAAFADSPTTTTVQPVTEISAQQAIIRYRTTLAPATACSVAITETVSGATPDDVNPSIFANANLDTRPGSIVNGQDRAFVFGQRTSMPGSDGLLHSRSAKANTAYTAIVNCAGSAAATVSFTTGNIQLGGTYTEQPPFHTSGFGNWAWPAIDWSTQSAQYPDPQTGIVIQRVDTPGWYGIERRPTTFDFAIGGSGWTNPQNILNGSACVGNSGTCAGTTGTTPLFVAMSGQNYSYAGPGGGQSSGYDTQGVSYDDFLAMLTGTAEPGATVSVMASCFDSGVTACPGTTAHTITPPTGTGTAGFPANGVGYSAPNNEWNPVFDWGDWGPGPGPRQGDFGAAYGTSGANTGVTTAGTSVTGNCAAATASWACFNVNWNNAYFYIQGSGCSDGGAGSDICQLFGHPRDPEHLSLRNAPATACVSQCNWDSLASGIVITPNGGGQVYLGATYSFAFSSMYELLAAGDQQVCNPVSVSVGYQGDGITPISPPVPGNLCFIQPQIALNAANGILFLLIPSTGETRLLSPLFTPNRVDSGDASGDQNNGQIAFPIAPWDGTCGTCLYGVGQTFTTTDGVVQTSLFQATYQTGDNWKAYSHPLYACGGGTGCNGGSQASPGIDPATGTRWSDDPLVYVNISKPSAGLSLQAQIAAHNPTYNTTIWPASNTIASLARTSGGYALFSLYNSGGYPQSINIFKLSTGAITSWGDTLNSYPMSLCGVHTWETSYVSPGWFGIVCNYAAANSSSVTLGGPFQAKPYSVYFGGTPSTNTAITATSPLEPCSNYTIAPNIMSLIAANGGANSCMHFRMQNLVSKAPSSAELALWPSPQNAAWSEPHTLQAGDELALSQYMSIGENDFVAAVTTDVTDAECTLLGGDCLDVVVARGVPANNLPVANVNGWTVQGGPPLGPCGAGGGCTPGVGAWIAVNTSGAVSAAAYPDPPAFIAHSDYGTGLTAGNMTGILSGYQVRFNTLPTAQFGTFADSNQIIEVPSFQNGPVSGCQLQSYPSNEQYNAPSEQEKRWFTDFHAMNGPNGTLGGGDYLAGGLCNASYSAASGFSTVYDFSAPAGGVTLSELNYKTLGIQGWAGHNLLQDVSGPSSSLSDSNPYQMCFALSAGECHSGTLPNTVHATVPYVPGVQTQCITSWLIENYPCVGTLPSVGGWLVQHDASYSYSLFEGARRMTMGLSGYGRQYPYNTFIPESTGDWGMFKADWADGVRSAIFMAKLPPFPGGNTVSRSTWVNYPVQVPGGAAYAEIEFGYMENGAANSHFCTPRQDACTTSGSPFFFSSIDTRTLTGCLSGCTINIPTIAGRAVYYSVGSSADGSTWAYGSAQVGLVQ